jgi:hypothetical protein
MGTIGHPQTALHPVSAKDPSRLSLLSREL